MIPIWLIVLAFVAFLIGAVLWFIFSCDPEGRGSEYAARTAWVALACMVFAVSATGYDVWRHFAH